MGVIVGRGHQVVMACMSALGAHRQVAQDVAGTLVMEVDGDNKELEEAIGGRVGVDQDGVVIAGHSSSKVEVGVMVEEVQVVVDMGVGVVVLEGDMVVEVVQEVTMELELERVQVGEEEVMGGGRRVTRVASRVTLPGSA